MRATTRIAQGFVCVADAFKLGRLAVGRMLLDLLKVRVADPLIVGIG